MLSTQHTEITHILAERVAILIGRDSSDRTDLYRRVKDLYKIRSKLVHGKASPKRGPLKSNSLFITAKHANVPTDDLASLFQLVVRVIKAFLADRALVQIIQVKRSERKVDEDLDQFFADRLFS